MIVLNAHNMCPDLTPNVSWILHLIILKENILKHKDNVGIQS